MRDAKEVEDTTRARKLADENLRRGFDYLYQGFVTEEVVCDLIETEVARVARDAKLSPTLIRIADREPVEVEGYAHDLLPEVVTIANAGEHLFLVGPAGSGKSTLAEQACSILGLTFHAISFGPTTPTSKLFGYMDGHGEYRRTPFRDAWEYGGGFLADEMDNAHPGLLAEWNQALAGNVCAFADGMIRRHDNFRAFASGNTHGLGPDRLFVGRNILDAATLDRFTEVEVPIDENLERDLAEAWGADNASTLARIRDWVDHVRTVRTAVERKRLPVVVSPRATIGGSKLIAHGLPISRCREIRLFKGLDPDTRSVIDPGWSGE